MPRIIVTTNKPSPDDPVASLDESVVADHLSDEREAAALVERLGWAISDAADIEAGDLRALDSVRQARARRPRSRSRAGQQRDGRLVRQVAVLLPRRAA